MVVTTIVLHACYGLPFFSRVVGTHLILATSKPKITDAFALAFARDKKYKACKRYSQYSQAPGGQGTLPLYD